MQTTTKQFSFACESCREGKRKCDGIKPSCSLCQRKGRECVYKTEARSRKRKYWDEEYVKALEDKVQSLLAVIRDGGLQEDGEKDARLNPPPLERLENLEQDIPDQQTTTFDDGERPEETHASPAMHDRSKSAMEELSVMMWRTNIADGVMIINDSSTGSNHHVGLMKSTHSAPPIPMPDDVLAYSRDSVLLNHLAQLFLDSISTEHMFVPYSDTSFLQDFPNQNLELVFLHSAVIATGAAFSTSESAAAIGEAFADYAENLAVTCCKKTPTLAVIQGCCILSWRSLALGRDHCGWMFISMAAGICVHLRLHVLVLEEVASRALQPSVEEVKTFWMFYLIDRTAISILGRNCALPWRRVNVPNFDQTFTAETADLSEISFAEQCRLWYLHDKNMDQIFASTFDEMPLSQQVSLLVSTHEALNSFFRNRDRRLDLTGDATPKPVLLFHMAYQMALLITMPPFLRLFGPSQSTDTAESKVMLLILRSLTYAASTMVHLVQKFRKFHTFKRPNPVMIHHLLSAAIVHLMNATSEAVSLKKRSTRWLRVCMELLTELRTSWPVRAGKTIHVIQVLAQRWGVLSSLPLGYSGEIESSSAAINSSKDVDRHSSSKHEDDKNNLSIPFEEGSGTDRLENPNFPPAEDGFGYDLEPIDSNTLDTFPDAGISGLLSQYYDPFQGGSAPGNPLQAFEGLGAYDDLSWLFGS